MCVTTPKLKTNQHTRRRLPRQRCVGVGRDGGRRGPIVRAHRRFSKPPRWAQAGSLGGHVHVERKGSSHRRPLAASAPVRVVPILPSLAVSEATLATQPRVWAAFLWPCARRETAGAVAPSSNYPWRNLLAFQLTGFFTHRLLWTRPSRPVQIIHKFELFKFELTSFQCIITN